MRCIPRRPALLACALACMVAPASVGAQVPAGANGADDRILQSLDTVEETERLASPVDAGPIGRRIDQGVAATGIEGLAPPDLAYGAFQRGYFLTAFTHALRQAREGDPTARTLLGELLSRGLGVKQNFGEAAEWYRLAAEAGDPEGAYGLARLYLEGLGVPEDPARAAELLKQAAEAGQTVAWRELAYLTLQGKGVEKNAMLAAAYLRRAALDGDAEAQYSLAGLFIEGVGVVTNPTEAAHWYREAARQNHYGAEVELALLYFAGRGVPKDEGQAVALLRDASLNGTGPAQLRYARLLAEGRGVKADPEAAARWYMIAREKGFRDDFMEDWLLRLDAGTRDAAMAAAMRWLGKPVAAPPQAETPSPAPSKVDNSAG